MIIYIITISLSVFYVIFLIWCLNNWIKIKDKSHDLLTVTNIKVAVIVPARNEAENLLLLLQSLAFQTYPTENLQIIISDDHSTDGTIEVAENFCKDNNIRNVICIRSPKPSKKEAISFAVQNSEAELIITTDADTFMGNEWVSAIIQEYVSTGSYMICGPVKLCGQRSYLEKLQSMEFIGLLGIGASCIKAKLPMFCNGANLAFSKKIFDEVGGYEKSLSLSGDDTQLMLKIHGCYPGKISFLKDSRAIVQTNVVKRRSEFLQQRRRWASKIPKTLSTFTVFISVFVWLVHVLMLVYFIYALIDFNFLVLFLPFIMISVSNIFMLKAVGKFFEEEISSWLVFLSLPLYCIYIGWVGLLAPIGTYQWKGRNVR